MDEGGVDAAGIHPRALDSNSTALALEPVRDYPRRFAIMGAHDLLFQSPNGSSGAWAGGSMRATIETGRLWRLGGGSANVPCWHTPAQAACPEIFPVLEVDRKCHAGANRSQFDP